MIAFHKRVTYKNKLQANWDVLAPKGMCAGLDGGGFTVTSGRPPRILKDSSAPSEPGKCCDFDLYAIWNQPTGA